MSISFKKIGKQKSIAVAAFVVFMSAAGLAAWVLTATQAPLRLVKMQLGWTHSSSYAGLYSAAANGDFEKRGLKVEFIEGGPKINPLANLISGKVDFAMANGAKVVEARADGAPIKALACIYRRNPLVFVTLQSSGIVHPRQFGNTTIRLSRFNVMMLRAMIMDHGVDFDTMNIISTNDVNKLADGEVDIWGGYKSGSLQRLIAAGLKVNVLHPDNFGVHFYDACIVTSDQLISEDPELVTNLLYASLRQGWPRAFERPEETSEVVKSYDPPSAAQTRPESISDLLQLVDMDTGKIGWMEESVWTSMIETLDKQGLLTNPIVSEDVFDKRFLERVFDSPAETS